MNVLVACEESQIVTAEFRARGHMAFSCDNENFSGTHLEWHLPVDVRVVLDMPWDMIIAFPPCTDLSKAGSRFFRRKMLDGRMDAAAEFFMLFVNAKCPKIAIENPIGVMSWKYRTPDQYIHPWQFGHLVSKKTCLWLKGLPKLVPTNVLDPRSIETIVRRDGRIRPKWVDSTAGNKSVNRSKTFLGIARAMAEQWG